MSRYKNIGECFDGGVTVPVGCREWIYKDQSQGCITRVFLAKSYWKLENTLVLLSST